MPRTLQRRQHGVAHFPRADLLRARLEDVAGTEALRQHFFHRALDALRERGIPLGVCTNKAAPITAIALEALGIRSFFTSVVGARDDIPRKPAPDMLLEALAELGTAPSAALVVGDSKSDIGSARAAGCPVIAVSYGYPHGPVAALGADAVIDRLPDLLRHLDLPAKAF